MVPIFVMHSGTASIQLKSDHVVILALKAIASGLQKAPEINCQNWSFVGYLHRSNKYTEIVLVTFL